MLRVLLTIVLPLVLPTALYVLWIWGAQRAQAGGPLHWAAFPWIWLTGAGAALLVIVLFVVTVHFGTPETGTYVAPHLENGRVVPGHIEPKPAK